MSQFITELEQIIADYTPKLRAVTVEAYEAKPLPHKWSKKEILGHLVDSAHNNSRRFIVAQYEQLPKVLYKQDDWVRICDYQNYPLDDLINLWVLINKHICVILRNISPEKLAHEAMTDSPHTIAWLAADYNKHLLHHLHVVLELEPVAYP